MPKLTEQQKEAKRLKHKKREANRAKLRAKQQVPETQAHVVMIRHQPGSAFRHSFDHANYRHTVHLELYRRNPNGLD